MNIAQIKDAIRTKENILLPVLSMVRQMDQNDNSVKTEWLSHWDNDARIRVTMHEDVFEQIKKDPEMQGLATKREEVPAVYVAGSTTEIEREAYVRYIVITPLNIEATF